jgi:hypothetical protein
MEAALPYDAFLEMSRTTRDSRVLRGHGRSGRVGE